MSSHPWKLIFQDTLPPGLRKALEKDAKAKDITMNDAAGRVLAERYDLEWVDTGSKFRPVVEPFRLRVPPDVWTKVRLDAIAREGTIRGIVLHALNQAYGLGNSDVRRRPRSPAPCS